MSKTIGIIDEPVQPGAQDNLDINIHSQALIEFIENSNTPITIGVQGEWGSGLAGQLASGLAVPRLTHLGKLGLTLLLSILDLPKYALLLCKNSVSEKKSELSL